LPSLGHQLRVGLTGGFGCGKSTVAVLLAELGARVIDADRLAREVLEPGTPQHREALRVFGDGVLGSDGRIDRRALAGVVFTDPSRRRRLEEIVHPPVLAALRRELEKGQGIMVAEIPLLYETDTADLFDSIIAVVADRERIIDRVARSRGMTATEIRRRLDSQINTREKARRADFVIENNASPSLLRRQVKAVYDQLRKKREEMEND